MNMKLHNPTLRVIEVIETVAENQSGLSLSQISRKINCPNWFTANPHSDTIGMNGGAV